MYVIVVDARYVRIGDDDEWEVAQSLYAMREADRYKRQGEICGGEEVLCSEWWAAMSVFTN